MIVRAEQFQTIFDLAIKFNGSVDSILAFMSTAKINNINQDIASNVYNLTANNNNLFVFNLNKTNKNIVTGSDYDAVKDLLNLVGSAYNDDFSNDYN
jgi:hypothetical protein